MTIISILGGDFEILFEDEKTTATPTAGMRTVRRASGASDTVYTTNQLYSAVAEAADDFVAMGFRNPMLPTTPNAYTMENKYFIPRSSTEYLKEGAITANYSLTASPDSDGNGVIKVVYSGGTNFDSGDIGRSVQQTDTGDTGILLDFDVDPNGDLCAWIRPDDSTPVTGDIFDGTGSLECTTDGGTGASTSSVAGISGTTQFSAIQAIGSVPTATEVYLIQDRIKLTDSTGGFQWWTTDPTVSLGIVSILVRVQDMGVSIADGDVEVFARRYTALYDNFRLNVAAGGFSALPLASAPDINNTTGYFTTNLSTSTGTWTVGNGIYQGTNWATATARGVITGGDNLGTADPDVEYYLVGDLTDLSTGAVATKEYDFATGLDADASATTVDSKGNNLGGPTDSTAGEGGTVTLALGGFLVDHTGNGVNEAYSVQFDAQGDVPIAKVYERLKYITRRGAPNTDLFGSDVNIPGETYRGLSALYEYDANGGTNMTEGDDVDNDNGALAEWTARLLHQNTTGDGEDVGSTTYITVTDQQTSIKSVSDDDIIYDETGGTQTVTVHAGGSLGLQTFTSPKSSPFGTFTGTQIFGARGVSFINYPGSDNQSYILTDDIGTLRNPPNTITFTVQNTASGDRVLVARDTGVDGIIDKDQFGGIDTPATTYNGQGDQEIRAAGSVDTEVPQSGYIRVVENTALEEHHYVYSSRTTGANGVFTLKTAASFTGTATAGTSDTVLEDTGQSFVTDGVEVGMLIRILTGGGAGNIYEVTEVTDADTLGVVQIFGTGGGLVSGDTYEINRLIQDYATSDDIYDLILDLEASGTSVSNSFIQSTNFDVVVNVRQGKVILPFTVNQAVSSSNVTVTVVRQPDNIAT